MPLELAYWHEHPDQASTLKQLIANPVFLRACRTILDAALPAVPSAVKGTQFASQGDVMTDLALRYTHRAGVCDFPRLLESLCALALPDKPDGEALDELLVPWGKLLSEEEIARELEKSRAETPTPKRRRK